MIESVEIFWKKRIEKCKEEFIKNNFDFFVAKNTAEAKEILLNKILPRIPYNSVSWGDSVTMLSTGIIDELSTKKSIRLIKTFEKGVPREEIIERRRQALLADLFFTGSNAVTESGKLVNLDMVGNRVSALTFGPKNVIVVVGRNKIVKDVEEAFIRIKNYSAPMNAIRHKGFQTPCIRTSYCSDCKSPDRLCNTWVITEKSFPKRRVKIVLINQESGL